MRAVKNQLEARNIPVFVVEATVGQSFADLMRIGLLRAKGMVAFCTSEYGAYTGVGYETFHELEFVHDHQLPLFPIRLCDEWPPAPQNNEQGIIQNNFVFKGLVYIDDRQMTRAQWVADQIAEAVAFMGMGHGIFETKPRATWLHRTFWSFCPADGNCIILSYVGNNLVGALVGLFISLACFCIAGVCWLAWYFKKNSCEFERKKNLHKDVFCCLLCCWLQSWGNSSCNMTLARGLRQ